MLYKNTGIFSRILACCLMFTILAASTCVDVFSNVIGFSAAMASETGGEAGAKADQAATQIVYAPLELGCKGDNVFKMKLRLHELGYFDTDKFSDLYDKETAAQVALFQEVNELEQTGIADADTLVLLFSDQAMEKGISEQQEQTYILNTNTKKFHYPDCASVGQMKEKNKKVLIGTRDQAINQGYVPCKNCKP